MQKWNIERLALLCYLIHSTVSYSRRFACVIVVVLIASVEEVLAGWVIQLFIHCICDQKNRLWLLCIHSSGITIGVIV